MKNMNSSKQSASYKATNEYIKIHYTSLLFDFDCFIRVEGFSFSHLSLILDTSSGQKRRRKNLHIEGTTDVKLTKLVLLIKY